MSNSAAETVAKPWYKKVPWWGWVAGVAVLLIIGSISNLVNPDDAGGATTVAVPAVVNMTASDATSALRDVPLTHEFEAVDESTVISPSNWTVIAQSPEPSSEVERGSTVTLTVQKTDTIWTDEQSAALADEARTAWLNAWGVSDFEELKDDDPSFLAGYVDEVTSPEVGTVQATLNAGAPATDAPGLVTFARASLSLFGSEVESVKTLTVVTADGLTASAERSEIPLLGGTPWATPSGLTQGFAQVACENRGESEYAYGFSPRWLRTGVFGLAGDAWQMKATVDIENALGNKAAMTLECTVSGTDDSPVVTHFAVY